MIILTTSLGIIGLLAVFFSLFILANISRRLGEVTTMKPYYRGFYVAMGILLIPLMVRIVRSNVVLSPEVQPALWRTPLFHLAAFYLPFAIAITISVIVAWRYWGWLFREPLP